MSNFTARRWSRPTPEPPLPLFDRPVTGRQMSALAARSIHHAKAFVEERVIEHLDQLGLYGATADETEIALELPQSTGSARFSELAKAGRIVRTSRTRLTRRGRAAFVHVHPKFAHGGEPCES
jgi:hypothetical protein